MKLNPAILFLVFQGACAGSDETYLWGEAANALARDWCDVRERCIGADEVDACVRHNVHHLCELEDTCEIASPEADEAMLLCSASLEEIDGPGHSECSKVWFGVAPQPCLDLLDLMPSGE